MADLTKLGKYEIRRELGKGAMGIVYEGFDPGIERAVAIKTIRPEQLEASQAAEILARFKREAQAAGRLNHPNIVAIYEFGEDAGAGGSRIAFIAMEFIKGKELKDYFDANQKFPLKEAERIMSEMLNALQHAHQHGVTHRDMKPANVILLGDGKVKVADFGIARIETSELTQAGTILGTPAYMSPEQFLGQPIDGRSDIFSCGVILYQFLTGEKPFTGAVTTIMHKVLKEEPLAPSMLNTTLPKAWDAVVRKAMAKSPADRYQTANEFAAAIRATVAGQSIDATVIDVGAGAADATVVDQPSAGMAGKRAGPKTASAAALAASAKPASKAGVWIGAAAGAILIVAGAGAFMFIGKGTEQGKPVTPGAASATTAVPATATVAPASVPVAAAPEPAAEAGTMVISALGLVDPKDPKFNGDAAAAQAEARVDAKRQLIEKALALMVDGKSLDKNYGVIQQKLLVQPSFFIKTVMQEGAAEAGKDGLIATEARAAVKMRDVQKSLNQMSKEERIEFIRNSGDPKISVLMGIRNADTGQAVPPERSLLAENVIKERIKSFGFRVWAADGETKGGPDAKSADFQIQGEIKLKHLSMRLEASGITITKFALTSWTIKAIDKASGEEIYLNTALPKQQKTWSSEDQALADIGKLVGEEFSKNFFLQHFNFAEQKVNLNISGLPGGAAGTQISRQLLREFRGIRRILDAQLVADSGKFALYLAEGGATDIIQDAVLKPLNAKLGQSCFSIAGATGQDVNVNFAPACAEETVRAKFETVPPAGLLTAPEARGKALLKGVATRAST